MVDVPPLWFDEPDALDRLSAARASGKISNAQAFASRELIETGFTVIKNVALESLCDKVARDFGRYLRKHSEYAARCVDEQGRHLRFVNFHGVSKAAVELGNTPQIMALLDFLFDRSAGIYTSLLFEYGSQQSIHRDSPFFHTFPINYFFGVWYALEDIHPDTGPLMYVPGGHRFQIHHRAIFEQVEREYRQLATKELLDHALERYYCWIKVRTIITVQVCY
jgi:phytanoyl-CoA hydroxylase